MARKTVAQKINEIVTSFNVSGQWMARKYTERRRGTKGYGYYTTVDVAYEGMRTVFVRNLAEAQEWAQERAEVYR